MVKVDVPAPDNTEGLMLAVVPGGTLATVSVSGPANPAFVVIEIVKAKLWGIPPDLSNVNELGVALNAKPPTTKFVPELR